MQRSRLSHTHLDLPTWIKNNQRASQIANLLDLGQTVVKYVTKLWSKVLVRSTNQPQTSYAVAYLLSELEALLEAYNSDKDLLSSYGEVVILKKGRDDQVKDKEPSTGSNRGYDQISTKIIRQVCSRREADPRLKIWKTISLRVRTGKLDVSLSERQQMLMNDYGIHLALKLLIEKGTKQRRLTTDLLNNWHNPEGRPYPHDLSKLLPLISDARGHQIILYDHFINNDLEYLKGGSSSPKYTTSITKAKAADYGHVKGLKTRFLEVYGVRIIAVTSLKIMEFFGYKHLEEITVRRQDDVLYKFREGDFKRLRREDIEDMLLLLVQGKLTNLNVDERFALNVALRMYTRRIVIQERVEDLQLAGIIYQDDMDRNHLMCIDELHKFSDGTLNQVRTFLNDIATGIQMEYLPKRKWTKQDKYSIHDQAQNEGDYPGIFYSKLFKNPQLVLSDIEDCYGPITYATTLPSTQGLQKDSLRSLEPKEIIQHHSDTQVITMKMEILLEPTLNKLMVERFDTSAGNPVKEILLKLNLLDLRIPKDGGEGYLKMEVKVPDSS
ncbi:hypothetical protein Tco_0156091 [Tanacetum coccineum]